MTFKRVEYIALRPNILKSIISEIKHHNPNQKEIDINNLEEIAQHIKDINNKSGRQDQAAILLITVKLLDKMHNNPEKQKDVLNAVSYYIYDKIQTSYKDSYNPIANSRNCNLLNSLGAALIVSTDNFASTYDLYDFHKIVLEFFKAHVYKEANPVKGKLDLQEFIFDSGYNLVNSDIKPLISKISEFEKKACDESEELEKKKYKVHNPNQVITFESLFKAKEPPTDSKEGKHTKSLLF